MPVTVDRSGPVTVLRMDHGKVNALDVELLDALAAAVDQAGQAPAGAVVLASAKRAFSAGVDLNRVVNEPPGYAAALVRSINQAVDALFSSPRPVVAAVGGAAIAGGCILACACDYTVIGADAVIGATELKVGVPFPLAALEVFRDTVGAGAERALFTAATYRGREAVGAGLAADAVASEDVLTRAVEVAEELSRVPPEVYAMTKRQLRGAVMERISAHGYEDPVIAHVWGAEDTRARLRAYMESLKAAG
jgi:enoyl-CoA hydratase/carnithine racemase